jgi:hypothetical protein
MAESEQEKRERLRQLRAQREAEVTSGATDWVLGAREVLDQALRNDARMRLDLIDELVETGNANIDEIAEKYGGGSTRDGHLSQVTTIMHGKARERNSAFSGSPDEWLHCDLQARTYRVHPEFADAWRKVRAVMGRRR